nr:MAG TPA: hypothetical protein [Caudoviricetes sp.]
MVLKATDRKRLVVFFILFFTATRALNVGN